MGGIDLKFLGVDGGGTSSEFIIIDEKGKILGHAIKPTGHYKQTSLANFEKILTQGVDEVSGQANIPISKIDYSFIGVPGYGETAEDIEDIESIVERVLGSNSYKCDNDGMVAWAGSLACNPGINIVAGTGAIGFGVDKNGKSVRAGGWGPFCGDEGSAYWLGKKAIEIFGKESDGRLKKTPLYYIMRSHLGLEVDFDIIDIVTYEYEMKRDKIAGLSKILYEAAKEGDKIAIDIFSEAAYEHFLTINSILEQLEFSPDQDLPVSYSGGVFKSGKYILQPLEEYVKGLNKNIKLMTPKLQPITGAALQAMNLFLGQVSEEIVEKLKSEEVKRKI